MARGAKIVDEMRVNPRANWTIADVEKVCEAYGISCKSPKRGSHYTLKHERIAGLLTIPARRPVKQLYVRLLVQMVDALERK